MTSPLDGPRALGTQTTAPPAPSSRQAVEKVLAQLPAGESHTNTGEKLLAAQRDELLAHTRRVNNVLRSYGVEFEVTGDPPKTITQIVDSETRELIRQIPSEEVLNFVARLDELRGLLLDGEA